MRILWIVNIVFPYPSKMLGKDETVTLGWLYGLFNSLKTNSNISLAIATTYNGNKLLKYESEGIIYYLLPCKNQMKYDKKLEKYWKMVNDEFKPDLAHIHGSEYAHGLSFINSCKDVKTVTSIQGLVSVCERVYNANIDNSEILKNVTLKDIIKFQSIYNQRRMFYKRGINEKLLLNKTNYVIGRTDWDHANYIEISCKDNYYFCNESLRDNFYDKNWDISKINKYTIFVSQAYYPIKGFHFIIEAIRTLKKKYPNIKCYVAGAKVYNADTFYGKLKMSGYGSILYKKIKKYGLENNIEFLGLLNSDEMLDAMLKCNVYVQGSAIENSPNSLGEAMLIGMPCISSNVGGVMNLLQHNEEGFVYPYTEYAMLAFYIDKLFSDSELCKKIGKNAQYHAKKTHDREINMKTTLNIYDSIIKKDDV